MAVLVDDGAIGADIDADAERVWPREPLRDQLLQQWVRGRERIGVDTGAFGHLGDIERLMLRLTAAAIDDARARSDRYDIERLSGDDAQLARAERFLDLGVDLGRHAVTVHFPIGTRVAEEALLRIEGKPAPNFPGVGANAVDHAPPIAALRHCVLGQAADPAPKRDEARAERDVAWIDRQRGDGVMRLRQEPAPRHGVDWTAMTGSSKRHDEIDHREPGAADQHGAVGIDARGSRTLPRIDIAGRPAARRLVMAGGEHRHVAREASAVIERDACA